ncbi:alkaline phosphatase [Jiulongibacter sediminis]|uniref:Alkaline phosphatase n=1 Tax=Jiulongibacter sediminis TaxID=1605367 RepID=A0A0P7BND9_9BACT|nr:alkaline phosphatase [Jiulongibacter sediminis]KPM46835.1 hypothetical protein AFM12_16450 [Jiulongibacter sediminis]TBX22186.1 hypothetical protein TK44_16460 [Jiulongibacter sediminis]
MNKLKTTLFLFAISFSTIAQQKPQNVIFMIGDGMGLSQISTAIHFKGSPSAFEQFKHIGFVKTSSAVQKVTDSAGAATAYATGQKSFNRAISVNTDSVAIPTILEQLEAKNFATGLISICSITDATPACFYAHATDRGQHEIIAAQLPASGVDFVAGGGRQYFTSRADGMNYLDDLKKRGYQVDTTVRYDQINSSQKYAYLVHETNLPGRHEGRDDYFPKTLNTAIQYFSGKKENFFLMAEGSYIDWAGHRNDKEMMIAEQLDFDEALQIAIDFVKKDKNTLLIVTADHETGGTAVTKGATQDQLNVEFVTDQHTATMVPIFAMGPGAELFQGIYENNEVYHKLRALIDF